MGAQSLEEAAQALPEVFEGVKKTLELEGVLTSILKAVAENAQMVTQVHGSLAPLQKLEKAVDTLERSAAKTTEDVKRSKDRIAQLEETTARMDEKFASMQDETMEAMETKINEFKDAMASETTRFQAAIEGWRGEIQSSVASMQSALDDESSRLDAVIAELQRKGNIEPQAQTPKRHTTPLPSQSGAPVVSGVIEALEGRVAAAEERIQVSEEGISNMKKKMVLVKDQAEGAEEAATKALKLAQAAQSVEHVTDTELSTVVETEAIGNHDEMLDGVKRQMSDIAKSVNAVHKRVGSMDKQVEHMGFTIGEVSHHVDKVTGVLRTDMESQVSSVREQVAQVEDEAVTAKQTAQSATQKASSAFDEAKRSVMKLDEFFTAEAQKPQVATQAELQAMLRQLEEVAQRIARQMPQVKDLLAGQLTTLRADLLALSEQAKEADASEKDALRKRLAKVAGQVKEFAIKFGAITTSCVACGSTPIAQSAGSATVGIDGRLYDHVDKKPAEKDVVNSSTGFTRQWEWCDTRTPLRKGGGFNTSSSHFLEGMKHSPSSGSDVSVQAALAVTKSRNARGHRK